MERERLGSRLGFILLSAGCAIGVGAGFASKLVLDTVIKRYNAKRKNG
jgi:SNF family Na+-dependent transporter